MLPCSHITMRIVTSRHISFFSASGRPLTHLVSPSVPSTAAGGAARTASYDAVSEDLCLNLLSHCNSKALKQGICVHSPIIKLGLLAHLPLSNRILTFYSKCWGPDHALNLFDELPQRDVVSWTSIISSHARSGLHRQALHLFDEMLSSDNTGNEFTLSIVLRCASSVGDFHLGASAHARIVKQGYESGAVVGSALVDHYSKCGNGGTGIEEACRVFEAVDCKDTVAWTTMISAAVQAEDRTRAMRLYASMLESGVHPNEFTFTKLLQACGSPLMPQRRCEELVHAHLIVWGAQLNLVLKTALVDAYSKCRRMKDAIEVLHLTPESDVTLWTAVVSGYTQAGDHKEAMAMLREMENAGVSPNSFTYAGIIHACCSLEALLPGKQIHSRIVKSGLEHDASVGSALVDLYSKVSSDIDDPLRAFRSITSPSVVSWTALISGLVHHGQGRDALQLFAEMGTSGVPPNSFTLSAVLRGCGKLPDSACRTLHGYLLMTGWSDAWNATVQNSLVDAYVRSGRAGDAWDVSRRMPSGRRDVVTYTSLTRGLNEMGSHREALAILAFMDDDGVKMDGFSLACFLSATAGLAAAEPGKQLHCFAVKSGLISRWISVSNSLIDMYGKCGCMEDARAAFREITEPNVVSWNGLISSLASSGRFSEALSAFEDMRMGGVIRPDGITFLLVMYACSHGGMVDLGVEYFESMGEEAKPEHYVCLVDMLGRAGRLEAAACAVETMPFRPDALIYKTLLASCRMHGNLVLGECAARRALEMDETDPAVYVLLAGLYDDHGKVEWGEETRRMMMERGVRKCPGRSWMKSTGT